MSLKEITIQVDEATAALYASAAAESRERAAAAFAAFMEAEDRRRRALTGWQQLFAQVDALNFTEAEIAEMQDELDKLS